MYSVSDETRKPIFEGVQGENEAREIQFDVTAWVEELGEGVCTATAKRPTDTTPYPVTVTRSGNVVTWKPNSTDTSIEGIGAFQLAFSINDVVAKTRIWNTKIAPSLVGAGDPPDPYDDWIQDLRDIAAETLTYSQNAENSAENAEAWAVGQRGGVDVPSTDPTYENNAKYYAEQSLANQYGAYIVKSASGDIASFSDGGDDIPMKSLKVAIVPKQAGSGDPSPSNVRPITGWTDADVMVAGKNLLSFLEGGTVETPNARIEWDAGKTEIVVLNNTTDSLGYRFGNKFKHKLKAGAYTFSTDISASLGSGMFVYNFDTSVIYGRFRKEESYTLTLQTETTIGIGIALPSGTQAGTYHFQIEKGTTATDYEPYTGHTTPVPLGQTVYGGEVDVATGILTITRGGAVYNGSENWGAETQSGTTSFYVARQSDAQPVAQIQSGDVFTSICPITTETWQAGKMRVTSGYYNFLLGSALGISTAEQFKTYLASNPISLCYKLATPTTVQLTPAQVATLLGTNNVWSDAGSVEVEYRADPTLAYNELANVIVSLGGNL